MLNLKSMSLKFMDSSLKNRVSSAKVKLFIINSKRAIMKLNYM